MSSIEDPKQPTLRVAPPIGNPLGISPASPSSKMMATENTVHYTCFIRLPFPRGDFVDPPQVDWNSSKDRALWKIISKASNSRELDWEDLSSRFEVSLPFLLQQAAWLYERHFAQMKAQMKKLSPSTCSSPIPPDSSGNFATNSGATAFPIGSQGPRAPSALSSRIRDSPTPTAGSGGSGSLRPGSGYPALSIDDRHPKDPGLSRTPSTRTLTQSRTGLPSSPAQPTNRSFITSFGAHRKPVSPPREVSEPESPPLVESSDSSSDGESQSMARSQAFRRPVNFANKGKYAYPDDADEEDDDDESSGGFLPFAAKTSTDDPAATLRSPHFKRPHDQRVRTFHAESSASSAGSSAQARVGKQRETTQSSYANLSPANALSPRHREELAKLSPRVRKEGSEGTPSMGSSFSDLDDASISQSALEEAFMSHMQHGSTASRMSSISQALRSKYL